MKKLIYLEDALNIAMQYCTDDDGSCGKSGVDIREMLDELELLPLAEPEHKMGKWKIAYADHEAFGVRPFYRYCSVCNAITVFTYNYCPNCGAEMQ